MQHPPSEPPSERHSERAIVFADVCQSTRLYETYGDVKALEIVGHAMAVMSEVVEAHGGVVLRTLGDEVFSTFPSAGQAVEAARRMQQATSIDPVLAPHQVDIRVGLHYGEVLQEGKEVYGDAVNLAARVASLAKAQQILTTGATVSALSPALHPYTRSLGRMKVKGKQSEIELCEFIWQEDTSELTIMPGMSGSYPSPEGARLVLRHGGREVEAGPQHDLLQLGRSEQNDVVVNHSLVSRTHAAIEYRHGKFVLRDRSTNGTYVCLEGGEKFFVHREELALHGSGMVGLGREPSDDNPDRIAFTCLR